MRKIGLYFVFGLLAPCAAVAQTAPPNVFVVDSTGKVVGPIQLIQLKEGPQYPPYSVFIKLKPSNTVVLTDFVRGGFPSRRSANHGYLYTTNDCSGTAYIAADPLVQRAEVFDDNFVFYTQRPTSLQIRSFLAASCISTDRTYFVAPAQLVSVSSQGFTPPFTLEFR